MSFVLNKDTVKEGALWSGGTYIRAKTPNRATAARSLLTHRNFSANNYNTFSAKSVISRF